MNPEGTLYDDDAPRDSITGRKKKQNPLNKTKLTKHELDEIFL
jgi:hypothetical protein